MDSPLEKARRDPDSMKAKILACARRVFGEYGFHGTTTRMIAQEAGIDISTLHYHWGEKKDLYEAVILDINKDLGQSLRDAEKIIHGRPLAERMAIAIDMMTDYLFEHPEISNLILFRHYGKTRHEANLDFNVPEFTGDIARSMNLTADARKTSPRAMMEVLVVMNGIHSFVSGEHSFRAMVDLEKEAYVRLVKDALKFVLIPAFAERDEKQGSGRKETKF
jgi:TetR/AcrR family transcriptional regulator, regulator of cefoperazone and chloramphenicol sensitivity